MPGHKPHLAGAEEEGLERRFTTGPRLVWALIGLLVVIIAVFAAWTYLQWSITEYVYSTKGGLDWFGQGRSCTAVTGFFKIDHVRYDATTLEAIDLSFEQHCQGNAPALHGTLHWDSADTTQPAGPVYPVPQGLWAPAPGVTPATGNYIYLESETNDWVGAGQTYTYTPDSTVTVRSIDGFLSVVVAGNPEWYGYFLAMSSLHALRPGLYGDLTRYGFNNPTKGGVLWWGAGRGCDTLHGWFTVDNVTYHADSLKAVDMRSEQHCEGAAPALHGAIHWIR